MTEDAPPDEDPAPTPAPATMWWDWPWWQAAGVAVALIGLLIAIVAWLYPTQPGGSSVAVAPAPATTGLAAATTSAPIATGSSAGPTASISASGPVQGPPTGPGVVAVSGSPVMQTSPNKNDYDPDMWDLDFNRGVSSTFLAVYSKKVDISLTYRALGAENGSTFAAWPGARPPTLADCGTLPPGDWAPSAAQEQLPRGATFCLRTSDERFGYLTVRDFSVYTEGSRKGGFSSLTLSFLVWKVPAEQ